MNTKAISVFSLSLLCVVASTSAFNITRILSNYPQYSKFDDLLTQTGLAGEINSRRTITVLVVSNNATSSVSGKSIDVVKRILSSHIILDYFDTLKLSKLQRKSNIITTLYQTTGIADDQQGFLNVTKSPEGIKFGSAMKGAPVTSSLVATVMTQPYNISVLEVSQIIEAPGIEGLPPPSPPSSKSSPPSPAPQTSPTSSPAPTTSPSEGTPSEAPAPASDDDSDEASSETPGEAPAPSEADSPDNLSPEADQVPADAIPAPSIQTSSSSRTTLRVSIGVGICLMALTLAI